MATTQIVNPAAVRYDTPVVRKPQVKVWAVIGAAFLILQLYIYARWITGPYFKSVPSGPTEVPMFMQVMVWIWIPGGIIAMLGCIYWFVVRPWRRDGRPSTDGLLLLGWISVLWQDPLVSYFVPQFTWSAIVPNMGSWTADVPGWATPQQPGAMMVEPLPFNGPLYVYALFTLTFVACALMRKTKARFPNIGTIGLIGVAWLTMAVLDFFMEVSWGVMGFYSYPGSIPGLTVFHGHYFQFPLYEPVLWGGCWMMVACLRYFKNDRGETLAERGISEMKISTRRKSALRFLAIVGAVNLCYLAYIVAFNFMGLKGHDWPADIQKRSYLTAHLCGPDSGQACPSPSLPVPRQGGVHFDQHGKLVIPDGVAPPGSETLTEFAK
jgi:hypothetical protein